MFEGWRIQQCQIDLSAQACDDPLIRPHSTWPPKSHFSWGLFKVPFPLDNTGSDGGPRCEHIVNFTTRLCVHRQAHGPLALPCRVSPTEGGQHSGGQLGREEKLRGVREGCPGSSLVPFQDMQHMFSTEVNWQISHRKRKQLQIQAASYHRGN